MNSLKFRNIVKKKSARIRNHEIDEIIIIAKNHLPSAKFCEVALPFPKMVQVRASFFFGGRRKVFALFFRPIGAIVDLKKR